MRVLSIDPAIRNTGYAVVEGDHKHAKVITYEVIRIPASLPQSTALAAGDCPGPLTEATHLAAEGGSSC